MAQILEADAAAIRRAADLLRAGALVAFPTETVYGLGGDARADEAVGVIFAAKGRPSYNPLIVHVAGFAAAERLGVFGDMARRLAAQHWPGPLTLVVRRRRDCGLSGLVSAGLDTVAIRVPGHPVARALLEQCAIPVAAPSANRSGHVSATTARHVVDDLGEVEALALILDDGPCPLGIESTVIDVSGKAPVILRPGSVVALAGQAAPGPQLIDGDISEPARPRAPGLLASHYAPRARLRLNATKLRAGEALLAFGADVPVHDGATVNLSERGDLDEAAANLFAALRVLDASGAAVIAVMPVPQSGAGLAINDRLRRAAAPRATDQEREPERGKTPAGTMVARKGLPVR